MCPLPHASGGAADPLGRGLAVDGHEDVTEFESCPATVGVQADTGKQLL